MSIKQKIKVKTFTGSGTKAAITADIEVEKYGKDNLVLILELDNILTVE